LKGEEMIGKVVTITSWLSFLAAVWLWLFKMLPWQGLAIMFFIFLIAFGFNNPASKSLKGE